MKMGRTTTLVAVVLATGAAAVRGFGPSNCVSVSRSSAGTCVLQTKCGEQDLSNFDISFDCLSQSGRQAHSMGLGAFDSEEEYDTDLKCQECLPPASAAPAASQKKTKPLAKRAAAAVAKGVSLAAVSVSREVKLRGAPAEKEEAEDTPKAEWFGPEECVGIWRDEKSGSCVMQTDCEKDTQLGVYEFGLICVDQDNEMTRHIFGMGSFGHKETFNTLIKCDQCLALDEYMDGDKAITTLVKMVKGMKADLGGVVGQVGKLSKEVFPKAAAGPASAPAPAAAASAPAVAQAAQFLRVAKVDPPPQQEEAPPPPQQAPTQPPAPPPAKAQPAAAAAAPVEEKKPVPPAPQAVTQHAIPQQQDANLGKDVVAASPHEVQHLKRKKSQVAAEPQSMQEILSAAVKGAAERGALVMGTAQAVMKSAALQKPQALQATQTNQQVLPVVQQPPAQEKVQVVVQESAAASDDESDEDEEDNHSKNDDDNDDE